MSKQDIQARVEALMKQMKENRAELKETAKAIHGEFYAETLEKTANMLVALKAASADSQSEMYNLLKQAAACVIMCGIHELFMERKLFEVNDESKKLAEAFQRDVVAITNHGYQRLEIPLSEFEGDDDTA